MKRDEYILQSLFAQWLDRKGVLYCASCGGLRTSITQAVRNKKSGYKKGFPDIGIYQPVGQYHGMFIELKSGSYPTPEQKLWCEELNKRGYKALIMPHNLDYQQSIDWLIKQVEEYLDGR